MASIKLGTNSLLLLKNKTLAAVNDAEVWPDGKLKSLGLFIRSFIDVFTSKGLILASIGFRIILHIIPFNTRAIIITKPSFLVFLGITRPIDRIIHTSPESPGS